MAAILTSAASTVATTLKSAIVTQPNIPDDWVRWQDAESEIQPDEEEKIDRLIEITARMQTRNHSQHGKHFRTTHVKSLAFVKGAMTVSSELPPYLRHGLFSSPGKTYSIGARYANEPIHFQPDTEKSPRGLGIKIFGVEGEAMSGEGTGTMDLHFNNAPMIELTDVTTCVDIFTLRDKFWDDPDGLSAELKKRPDAAKQSAPTQLPNTHLIGDTLYTQSAFAFGPYVAHISLVPTDPSQTALSQSLQLSSTASPDEHRKLLQNHFASHPATYDIRAQFSSDLTSHPVEDASVVWDEATAPWITLGHVRFEPQESWNETRKAWWEDEIALSPFNCLAAHRPLGSINRLRKRLYEASRDRRAEANGKEVRFPRSISEMP